MNLSPLPAPGTKRYAALVRRYERLWLRACAAEADAVSDRDAWRLAAASDRARAALVAVREGRSPERPAPRTRRNLALGGFATLALVGRVVARAMARAEALIRARVAATAARAARAATRAARAALRRVVGAVVALLPATALALNTHQATEPTAMTTSTSTTLVVSVDLDAVRAHVRQGNKIAALRLLRAHGASLAVARAVLDAVTTREDQAAYDAALAASGRVVWVETAPGIHESPRNGLPTSFADPVDRSDAISGSRCSHGDTQTCPRCCPFA